jgi:hypothetical protein
MKNSFKMYLLALAASVALSACNDDDNVQPVTEVGFEEVILSDGFSNGSDLSGTSRTENRFGSDVNIYNKKFDFGMFGLDNEYVAEWSSWSGWAISSLNDTETPGFINQYSVHHEGATAGAEGTEQFALSFGSENSISFSAPVVVEELYIANTTYTALDMLHGSQFSKQFGGADGSEPDYLYVEVAGQTAEGVETQSVRMYLADYRSGNPDHNFIMKGWHKMELRELGRVTQLTFTMHSSDTNAFGIKTPTYFAIDQLMLMQE